MPRALARSAITSRSPRITRLPGKGSAARSAQRSGPMPAGSPAVRAIRGARTGRAARRKSALLEPVLDECPVAHLAQPILVGLVGLACADRLACHELLAILRKLVGASLEHLHEVPAERRLDRLAYFAFAQCVHRPLEFGNRVAGG